MFRVLVENSANALWLQALEWFSQSNSFHRQGSRDGPTLEVLHAALSLENPRQRWIAAREPAMNPAFALVEVIWIIAGRSDSEFLKYFNPILPKFQGDEPTFHGAYGHRLRKAFNCDQLKVAAAALRKVPDSRQIVLQIWCCNLDLPGFDGTPVSKDVPCNVVALLKVRGNKLHWTQVMRSNDLILGLPHNIVQFTTLQEILAGWIGVGLGSYNHFSDSLHVYERDLNGAMLKGPKDSPMNPDNIAFSEEDSDSSFRELELSTERIIDQSNSAEDLLSLLATTTLPPELRNWLAIITADGCRRRGKLSEAAAAVQKCSNPCLELMWNRWSLRAQKK